MATYEWKVGMDVVERIEGESRNILTVERVLAEGSAVIAGRVVSPAGRREGSDRRYLPATDKHRDEIRRAAVLHEINWRTLPGASWRIRKVKLADLEAFLALLKGEEG